MLRRVVFLFVFFSMSFHVWAQGTTSRALGVVTDTTGAVVPGATVQLTNEATGVTFTTQTTAAGTYVFEAVQPGAYTVAVEAPGFKKFTSKGNQVTIGVPMTVNVSLEVGAITEQVQVSAMAEAVQTDTSGNFGNVLTSQQIRDLPIVGTRGRNPLGLVDIQPGVINTPSITGGAVHVFGARDRAWNYTLDGIDNNETSAGGSDFAPLRTNPDSLQEFRVITSNASAEYGRSSGGQVAMITRSGSNEFHGSGFEFYRTPRLNANEWENNFNKIGKRQLVQHIFGGDVGGPIWKNHTFFFYNGQWLREVDSLATTRTVLTAQARQGILRFVAGGRNGNSNAAAPSVDAQGNVLPGVSVATYNVAANDPLRLGLDKTIAGIVTSSPLPNRFDVGDGLNTAGFIFPAATHEKQNDNVIKIDHVLNSRNAVYARIAWGHQNTFCDRGNGGAETFPGTGCVVNTFRDPKNLAFNWRWNPTARLTNELVVGQNRFGFVFDQPKGNLNGMTLNAPGLSTVIDPSIANSRILNTWQIVDNVAYQVNAHALKFGTNIRMARHHDIRGSIAGLNSVQGVSFDQDFDPAAFNLPSTLNATFDRPTFQNLINYMLGRVGTVTRGFVANANGSAFVPGLLKFNAHWNEYDFFAQDTWKLRRNLTVDLGLRWEPRPAPTAEGYGITHPDQPLVAGAPPTNTAKWVSGSVFKDRMDQLAPSAGIAWDPFGTGKTSIRANYRLAYDRLNTFSLSSAVFANLPGLTTGITDKSFGQNGGRLANLSVLGPPSLSPDTLRQPAPFSSGAITVVDPNFKFPTTHEWSADIQREIADRTVVQIAYIGRRAYHLTGAYDANQVNIFQPGLIDAFQTVKAGGQSDLVNRLFSADSRIRAGQTASDMIRQQFTSALNLNSIGALYGDLARRVQGGKTVTVLSGASPFALIPYPQFTGGVGVIDSNDFSTYHGLVTQIERRFKNGIAAQFSYTFSRALATRSFDPTFTRFGSGNSQTADSTPYDIYNRKLNYSPADYDHRHVFQANWTAELPFGRGKRFLSDANGMLQRIAGGWEIAGIFTRLSGRPFAVYSGAFTFNDVVQSFANCNGCGHFGDVFNQNGVPFYFTADQRAKFSAPAVGQLGSTERGYFRGPRFFDIDMSLLKRIMITEKTNLEFRADATNITNTVSFALPTATITSTTFGRIGSGTESASRKIQLGAKFNF